MKNLTAIFFYISSCLFLSLAYSHASEENPEIPNIENMTAEEIANLSPKVGLKLPAKQMMSKIMELEGKKYSEEMWNITVSFPLYQLLYFYKNFSPQDLSMAIKNFQEDIGENPTGELTVGQMDELFKRVTKVNETKIIPIYGDEVRIYSTEGYASVQGTMILEGEEIADPVNITKFVCDRGKMTCSEKTITIDIPDIDDSRDYYFLIEDETHNKDIISWSKNEIVAQTVGDCRTTIFTMNLSNNEVYEIVRNNNKQKCNKENKFVILPKLSKPRIARLVPSKEVIANFWKTRKTETKKFLNPRAMESMKSILQALSNKNP